MNMRVERSENYEFSSWMKPNANTNFNEYSENDDRMEKYYTKKWGKQLPSFTIHIDKFADCINHLFRCAYQYFP